MTGFPETRGSLVAAMKSGDRRERDRALETLAGAYWKAVYTYIRLRFGRTHDAAADLTQDFFVKLSEGPVLERFDPGKARLRTYLRVVVDGLVANDVKAERRLKRGGGRPVLSLDFDSVRREVDERHAAADLSPEDLFEKEWVRSVFALAVERLRETCTGDGHTLRFALFAARVPEGPAGAPTPEGARRDRRPGDGHGSRRPLSRSHQPRGGCRAAARRRAGRGPRRGACRARRAPTPAPPGRGRTCPRVSPGAWPLHVLPALKDFEGALKRMFRRKK